MAKGYDSLNDTFNTDGSVEVDAIVKADEVTKVDEVKKDYDYTRGNLYSLIEKGQEAINGIMEVAGETASPRAYEVAGQLIKSVADTTDKLADLHKKLKENGIRAKLDARNEKMGAKIRNAELNKIPLMIILGEKEMESSSISVRRRFVGDQGSMDLDSFLKTILDEIKQRAKSSGKSDD